mmetsp:Transcript_51915/g.112888  ORF Transcript_51915/g.112888 Transcript_51915/m.112888 type:complete len:192 (-) Transcript_51915:293-868(-)
MTEDRVADMSVTNSPRIAATDVVVDLEAGTTSAAEARNRTFPLRLFKRLFKTVLIASWLVLGAFAYLSESVALAGLSLSGLVFSVYFMVFPRFLAYLKRESEHSRRKEMGPPRCWNEELSRFEHMCPSISLDDETSVREEACAICLGAMEAGEQVRRLPCGHVLHTPCLDEWWFAQVGEKKSCPLCRHPSY